MGCGKSKPGLEVTKVNVEPVPNSTLGRLKSKSDFHNRSNKNETMGEALVSDVAGIAPTKKRMSRRVTTMMPAFKKEVERFSEIMDHPALSENRLRKIFQMIDVDGDGELNVNEIQKFWKKMGWAHSVGSLKTMFSIADSDNSGSIDWKEFSKFFSSLSSIEDLLCEPDGSDNWQHTQPVRTKHVEPASRRIKDFSLTYLTGFSSRIRTLVPDKIIPYFIACGKDDKVANLIHHDGCIARTYSHGDKILAAALSSSGKYLATAGAGVLFIWNTSSGVLQSEILGTISCLCWEGDNIVWGGMQYGSILRAQVRPHDIRESDRIGRGIVLTLKQAGDKILIGTSKEPGVIIVKRNKMKMTGAYTEQGAVGSLSLSHTNKYCLSICDTHARVWEVSTQKTINAYPISIHCTDSATPHWLAGCFLPIDFGQHVAVCASDSSIYIFNTVTNSLSTIVQVKYPLYSIASTAAEQTMFGGDKFGNICKVNFN